MKPNGKKEARPYKIEPKPTKQSAPIFQDVFGKLSCEDARKREDIVCITAAKREGTVLVP